MRLLRSIVAATSLAALLVGTLSTAASAAIIVECGQISAYTAPDPAGPTDGSLTIGLLPPWTIAADATVGANAAAALPSIAGNAPSCVTIDVDGSGVIHSIDIAPTGEITGTVAFEASFPGYIHADRLLVPTFITDLYPGLEAIFATSYAAETVATVVFTVDVSTGQFSGVDARAHFCGDADVAGNGDGIVGDAVIPAEVLDATDTERLAGAGSREACATVRTVGTIEPNGGALDLTTNVRITVAGSGATPPPTDTVGLAGTETTATDPRPFLAIVAMLALMIGGAVARLPRRRERRGI
jgi:hypothetical protein